MGSVKIHQVCFPQWSRCAFSEKFHSLANQNLSHNRPCSVGGAQIVAVWASDVCDKNDYLTLQIRLILLCNLRQSRLRCRCTSSPTTLDYIRTGSTAQLNADNVRAPQSPAKVVSSTDLHTPCAV
ncbi:hypothetical protein CBL_07866 [Carabus blaptoides fortunei]